MKSLYIGNLVPNEVVTGYFLVISKEIRQKKTGEPYLALHLADRTGDMEAKMWDNVSEIIETFDRDDFVKVKGILQVHQHRLQFTIHRLRRLEDHEVDLADYFPCSDRDPDEMFTELQGVIATVQNTHLRALLEAIFADHQLAQMYKTAPAAKNIHHACRGGLLEHVLSLCSLSRLVASHYKDIDIDLLIVGVILHDIGKVEELSYARSFGYSAEGQLLGHIVIGLRLLAAKLEQLPQFPPRLRTLIEHMILSHHGELEFGSPKVPAFREAFLLHHLDNLDSKMNAVDNALKRDSHADGEFTGWIAPLERSLLKKERFLEGKEAKVKPAPVPQAKPAAPDGLPAGAPIQTVRPQGAQEQSPAAHVPGQPVQHPASDQRPASSERRPEQKPTPMTLFGEKLQAVLEPRK
jgi:3'-5' exoribonuclease